MKQMRAFAAMLFAFASLFGGAALYTVAGQAADGGSSLMKITVQACDKTFTARLEDNAAARAFADMMRSGPLSVSMSDYGGFEKVGSLGRALPAEDRRLTTSAGDIVLYNRSQIVAFYGSNTWSYTRLARIENLAGWREALGGGAVTLVFSLQS